MKMPALLFLSVCLLAASGCSKKTSHTTRTADGNEVTLSGDGKNATMEIKTKDGQTARLQASAKGVEIPADFPKDVPVYPKSLLRMTSGGGAMSMFGFVLPATVAEGMAYYEKEFATQGWKADPHMNMGEGMMLHGAKAGRSFTLMIAKDGKDTYAQLTLSGAN